MSSFPMVDEFLRLVVVLTVSPAKLYAEGELKFEKKSTEILQEYPILVRVTVSWIHQIKLDLRIGEPKEICIHQSQ